jgi:hypothetical protein
MESLFAVLAAGLVLGKHAAWTALLGGVAVMGGVPLTRREREGVQPRRGGRRGEDRREAECDERSSTRRRGRSTTA